VNDQVLASFHDELEKIAQGVRQGVATGKYVARQLLKQPGAAKGSGKYLGAPLTSKGAVAAGESAAEATLKQPRVKKSMELLKSRPAAQHAAAESAIRTGTEGLGRGKPVLKANLFGQLGPV
jgi:ABC-type proline/glycine betaine transport system substrate-binding protein